MSRQNYMVTTYSEIALEQFQILRENYQYLEGLDKMCGEALVLKHDILNRYVYVITFASIALEAFLNDYAADKMGDAFFYENFESLRPFAKLQLIAKVLYNTTLDKGEKIYCLVNQLFKERNSLVHSKSRELTGMSQEEWEEFNHFLETDENANDWLIAEHEKLDISEEKESFASAHQALRGLKEVANFIDDHDKRAYATAKLLYSGWAVDGNREKYSRIQAAQNFLGVEPLYFASEA